jgi:hypothetical protein
MTTNEKIRELSMIVIQILKILETITPIYIENDKHKLIKIISEC